MQFDTILYPTEQQLFALLLKKHKKQAVYKKNKYILVQGEAPVLLVAHLDTVHREPVRTICRSNDGNILMSPKGIGGDDRCGVYALETIYESATAKPWLLFTCGEEIGGIGADAFCLALEKNFLPKKLKDIKLIVEIDRKGRQDAVYYNCDCPELETYINGKGFHTEYGSFSDISLIAPDMGIAAVNLSSGYYNAHTEHEYIVMAELENTIAKVKEIVQESLNASFPVYKYKEKKISRAFRWNAHTGYGIVPYETYGDNQYVPPGLQGSLRDKYKMLLDIYAPEELEDFINTFGDDVLNGLYEEEFGEWYEPAALEYNTKGTL